MSTSGGALHDGVLKNCGAKDDLFTFLQKIGGTGQLAPGSVDPEATEDKAWNSSHTITNWNKVELDNK